MWKLDPLQLGLALGLDLALGDPPGWPHPVRAVGRLATLLEGFLSRSLGRGVFAGLIFWLGVNGTILASFVAGRAVLRRIHPAAAWVCEVFLVYQTLAATDLQRHVRAVLSPLKAGDLPEARAKLAMIVGRDTGHLDESEVSRAAIESVAESSNDAFVAPLLWAVAAGAPGALWYRTVNTLDSIAGHRNERYERFGKISARADDALNWVPARLCAAVSESFRGFRDWKKICRAATAHASPNAGWSEAAAAFALDVRLGGTNFYDGIPLSGPVFNPEGRIPTPDDLALGLDWFRSVAATASGTLMGIALCRYLFFFAPSASSYD
jgi:adenosylcobinamide-phosphate synthase